MQFFLSFSYYLVFVLQTQVDLSYLLYNSFALARHLLRAKILSHFNIETNKETSSHANLNNLQTQYLIS